MNQERRLDVFSYLLGGRRAIEGDSRIQGVGDRRGEHVHHISAEAKAHRSKLLVAELVRLQEFGSSTISENSCCRRFVFMGHVSDVKGVREILALDGNLPDSVTVDVFGPCTGAISERDFDGCNKVWYRGIVEPAQVIFTLAQYDALLLPTYHIGEGYPGVIVEAYAAGLPVVCTRWRALPEIVDCTSGILVEPRNSDALFDAMKRLIEDDDLYARLREGARKRRREFSSEVWNNKFVEYCRDLARLRRCG